MGLRPEAIRTSDGHQVVTKRYGRGAVVGCFRNRAPLVGRDVFVQLESENVLLRYTLASDWLGEVGPPEKVPHVFDDARGHPDAGLR